MRFSLPVFAGLFLVLATQAAEKKLPIEQTSNELVEISANALIDKDQIRQELGGDLGEDMVVVRVTFRPVSDKPLQIALDDFLLVSAKDGQRSQPFAPSQIAGSTTLMVTPQGVKKGGVRAGPTFGGLTLGRNAGNASSAPQTDAKVETTKSEQENPMLEVLKAKILPEKETTEAVSGLLYFQITGKLKPKDLELHYKGSGGHLQLRFRP